MKKRIFSMLLAIILCFGMTEGVFATESSDLPVPNISWNTDGSWSITADMKGAADGSLIYIYNVYCGEERTSRFSHSYGPTTDKSLVIDLSEDIIQSGNYKVVAYSIMRNADGSTTKGTEVETEYKFYTRPATALGTTVAIPDVNRAGVFTFNRVEGAGRYRCDFYRMVNGVATPQGFQTPNDRGEGSTIEVDFSSWIREAGEYFLEIKAISPDVNVVANGDVGAKSEIINTGVAVETINDKVGNASSYANAAEGLNYLLSSSSEQDLQVAMQTDTTVRGQIATLENNYANQNGITVAAPEVSAEAAAYVNPNEISMVGAALNAAAGNNVKLAVTKPATAIILDSIYSNVVQLDLKLWCDDTSVSDLRVPITITMPMPAGVHPTNLRLMHYHDGDTVGSQVSYAMSEDGKYITFTVDSFSTFVFVNVGTSVNGSATGNDDTTVNGDSTINGGAPEMAEPQYEMVPGGWPWNEIVANATAQAADATVPADTAETAPVDTTLVSPKTGDMDMTWNVILCVCSSLGILSVLKKKNKVI